MKLSRKAACVNSTAPPPGPVARTNTAQGQIFASALLAKGNRTGADGFEKILPPTGHGSSSFMKHTRPGFLGLSPVAPALAIQNHYQVFGGYNNAGIEIQG